MALHSLTVLLDDIAYLLDDIATLTKVATKKTAGVLGDDLALNAQQVAGVHAARELPVVWAVAKGSFRNKAIIVPAALLFSAFLPWLIIPLLMIGGSYLCYEGFEKLWHHFRHGKGDGHHLEQGADDPLDAGEYEGQVHREAHLDPEVDLVALERKKIIGAIRTDFVLSTEIIVITLGTVAAAPFLTQAAVLTGIAIIMTVGVYGLVAGIVKIDDGGIALMLSKGQGVMGRIKRRFGRFLLAGAPYLMRTLSIVGTIAMFLVGGGILIHGIAPLEEMRHGVELLVHGVTSVGPTLGVLASVLFDTIAGVIFGALVLILVAGGSRLWALRSSGDVRAE